MFNIIKDFKDFRKYKKLKMEEVKRLSDLYCDRWILMGYIHCEGIISPYHKPRMVKLTVEANPAKNEIRCTDYSKILGGEYVDFRRAYHNLALDCERAIIDSNLIKYGVTL